jgi:hypothetical protein
MQNERQAANERAWNALGPEGQHQWRKANPGLRPEDDFSVFGVKPTPVVAVAPSFQGRNVVAALVIVAVLFAMWFTVGASMLGPKNIHSSYSDNQGNSLTSDCVVDPGAGTVSCNSDFNTP